jgi:hypothetical protein
VDVLERLSPIELSGDVIDYIRSIFVIANDKLCDRVGQQPNVHEESLDLAFLDAISSYSGPHRTVSDTVVDIDVHFVGAGWHLERSEVADIGIIATFRRLSALLRTKVLLLQSKRLYPREADFVEAHGFPRPGDFMYLVPPGGRDIRSPRSFRFDLECCYRALQVGDRQWAAIAEFERRHEIPVHYLLYHPGDVPSEVVVPVQLPLPERRAPSVGTRVMSAAAVRSGTATHPRNYAPSFQELAGSATEPGTSMPEFMVDDLLGCREGYVPENFSSNLGIQSIFYARDWPIVSAILIDIDLPATVNQQ